VGAGVRVGWTGKVLPGVSLGATWASKVKGKFDEYKGLFANGGEFDVPENYALGVAVLPSSDWSLGADVQTIRYSHARQPDPAGETFFNILAPGVLQDHFTLGATLGNTQPNASGGEWSGFLAYAPSKTISGSNSIPPGFPPGGFGGGNANIRLKETIIGVSYGWKL
jgi:long-chain fatty acid transport protein